MPTETQGFLAFNSQTPCSSTLPPRSWVSPLQALLKALQNKPHSDQTNTATLLAWAEGREKQDGSDSSLYKSTNCIQEQSCLGATPF